MTDINNPQTYFIVGGALVFCGGIGNFFVRVLVDWVKGKRGNGNNGSGNGKYCPDHNMFKSDIAEIKDSQKAMMTQVTSTRVAVEQSAVHMKYLSEKINERV